MKTVPRTFRAFRTFRVLIPPETEPPRLTDLSRGQRPAGEPVEGRPQVVHGLDVHEVHEGVAFLRFGVLGPGSKGPRF